MGKIKKVHFLLIYPLHTAPSQRFRFEQFFPAFEKEGYLVSTNCFYDADTFSTLYTKGGKVKLAARMLICFLRRCLHLFTLSGYDCILVQRGAAPFGPPLFEWVIRYIYRKPIIYDFDDAIWLQPEKKISLLQRWVKSYSKVGKICRWSHTVVVGNQYLAEYANKFSKNVRIIPTVVDTDNRFVPVIQEKRDRLVIGWTGSHSTLPYLESLTPVLSWLQQQYNFELLVMANKAPALPQTHFQFVPWSEEAEVAALQQIDIGIMPLPDDEWTKGKCGFKAIQYMALGKPAVASAVGVNGEIIEDGINGLLCSNEQEWTENLGLLLENPNKIKELGRAARQRIDEYYSLRKAAAEWLVVLASA
ncbi:glycosyltransferase [Terrimonas alba]|uniref:glycosyltransferase n=1 Tax=Terrimonas alba TaxID=3349636 RepID=UPI0035F43C72